MDIAQVVDSVEMETKSKDSYGESERLSPDQARRLIRDLVWNMQEQAIQSRPCPKEESESIQKRVYGDAWTLLYGISIGISNMGDDKWKEYNWDDDEVVDHGINVDGSWQEHYDEFGYGTYGRGLEIGRQLAFYEGRDFDISADVSSETDSSEEPDFTIQSYD